MPEHVPPKKPSQCDKCEAEDPTQKLSRYLGEWWCEDCIVAEEYWQWAQEIGR